MIFDEAHNYFRNNDIIGKGIKETRNIGLKFTAVSQSPDLTDELFENISHLFVGLMNSDPQIKAVRSMLPFTEKSDAFIAQVKSLRKGCFLYFHMKAKKKFKIRVRPRITLHTAATEIEDEYQYMLNAPGPHKLKKKSEPIIDYEMDPQHPEREDPFEEPEIKKADVKPQEKIEKKSDPPKEIKQPKKSEKNENALTFAKDYKKLSLPAFSTIRLKDKYKIGDKLFLKTPTQKNYVVLINKIQKKLADIPSEFLTFDTDTDSRENAIKDLKKYYPELTDQTECWIYRFVYATYQDQIGKIPTEGFA